MTLSLLNNLNIENCFCKYFIIVKSSVDKITISSLLDQDRGGVFPSKFRDRREISLPILSKF